MQIITVSQLNKYIKTLLDYDELLNNVYIKGELSNFKLHYASGHCYMTLKDEGGVVKAVMFRSAASKLKFTPENGMKVIVNARVSVYERDGVYQLYINEMQPDGIGALHIRYNQLKDQLEKEGLFDERLKKGIPKYPEKIGIITSPTGAAIRDILNVISRRYPICQVYIFPAQVQGEEAKYTIVEGLLYFNKVQKVDTIIAGRGGGSIEDLWCFNEEMVARAIFDSEIPVISAVGHETDFTIADFTADLRAPTPSAAAELAVPDITELIQYVSISHVRLMNALKSSVDVKKAKLKHAAENRFLSHPMLLIEDKIQRLSDYSLKMSLYFEKTLKEKQQNFIRNVSKLDSLSPLQVLKRGYSFVEKEDGQVIDSIAKVHEKDILHLSFHDGKAKCVVHDIEK